MQLLCSADHSYDNFVLEDWYIEMLKCELYSTTGCATSSAKMAFIWPQK